MTLLRKNSQHRRLPTLGRLQPVALRSVWPNEERDFTPWLARPENLKVLANVLGFPLTLVEQEKSVGPFFADLVCRSTAGQTVLIENQLDLSDHTHLGQVITYAATLRATTMVWIASEVQVFGGHFS